MLLATAAVVAAGTEIEVHCHASPTERMAWLAMGEGASHKVRLSCEGSRAALRACERGLGLGIGLFVLFRHRSLIGSTQDARGILAVSALRQKLF